MSKYDDMGFVSLDDIMNVFVTAKTKLTDNVLAYCPTIEARGDSSYVVEFFESVRLELMKRAKANLNDYLRNSPQVKKEERDERAAETAEKNKVAHEHRLRMGRRHFET